MADPDPYGDGLRALLGPAIRVSAAEGTIHRRYAGPWERLGTRAIQIRGFLWFAVFCARRDIEWRHRWAVRGRHPPARWHRPLDDQVS